MSEKEIIMLAIYLMLNMAFFFAMIATGKGTSYTMDMDSIPSGKEQIEVIRNFNMIELFFSILIAPAMILFLSFCFEQERVFKVARVSVRILKYRPFSKQ